MAPIGPKKGSVPNPRGTGKPSNRGGISKRRGASSLKVDRDGDLNMDASAMANASQSQLKRSKNNSAPSGPITRPHHEIRGQQQKRSRSFSAL